MLTISPEVLARIVAHARREAPLEACGYLAATGGVICRHYELTNIDQAPDHYGMDPAEQFAAVREMRGEGLTLAGVYHSHPCTPARPSAEDIRLAFDPEIPYVILSLAGEEPTLKAFRIRGQVAEEPLVVRSGSKHAST